MLNAYGFFVLSLWILSELIVLRKVMSPHGENEYGELKAGWLEFVLLSLILMIGAGVILLCGSWLPE